jgi:hypothetical protein
MKCTEILFGRKEFEAWEERMKGKVKNITTI